MAQICDVCVSGAGPAGTAADLRLTDLGLSALILHRPEKQGSWRGESFTGAIRQPLAALGIWDDFCAPGHVPSYDQRIAWGSESWSKSSIFSQHGNLWHVDRARFDSDLVGAAQRRGAKLLPYRTLSELYRSDEQWSLRIDGGIEISAKYLVDATGRSRALGRRLAAKPQVHDRLIALTTVTPRNANSEFHHSMVIEATPHGWWYAAPVPQGHVLAFFTDADLVPRELANCMHTVAANSVFTQPLSGQGWLAVGDACAAHDPLCGWGVYRAIANGILAADAMSWSIRSADNALLEAYNSHCRKQFDSYLKGLTKHYSLETRWASTPFWERRTHSLTLN